MSQETIQGLPEGPKGYANLGAAVNAATAEVP